MVRKEQALLSETIIVEASLNGGYAGATKLMDRFPNAKAVLGGAMRAYAIMENGAKTPSALVELGSGRISYTYYYTKPTKRNRNVNFLKLLSILAYLKDAYTVQLGTIYERIIEIVTESDLLTAALDDNQNDLVTDERIGTLNSANVNLSRQVLMAGKQCESLQGKLIVYEQLLEALRDRFSGADKDPDSELIAFFTKLGVSDAIATSSVAYAKGAKDEKK